MQMQAIKMMNLLKILFLTFSMLLTCRPTHGFTPSRNMEFLTEMLDLDLDEKPVSGTLTHMDIMRLGLVRSIARYFAHNQQTYSSNPAKHRVRLEKSDSVYANKLAELYKDYMDADDYAIVTECGLRVEQTVKELTAAVANVDFDKQLKDLPSAHFDANTFVESNRHVRKLRDTMLTDIQSGRMASARVKLGTLLHTIHDFYSHSNWIEMGNVDRINELLGTEDFESNSTFVNHNHNNRTFVISEKEVACLSDKCVKKVLKCNYLKGFVNVIKHFSMNVPLSCPIVYYVCKDNVITDKLTSGYFTGQRFENGDEVSKPANASRCSHGGAFDASSLRPAEGGINKDTAFYFLSPRADLHATAADLAVRHTEWFMDKLRVSIGNHLFEELLQLFHTESPSFMCFIRRVFS